MAIVPGRVVESQPRRARWVAFWHHAARSADVSGDGQEHDSRGFLRNQAGSPTAAIRLASALRGVAAPTAVRPHFISSRPPHTSRSPRSCGHRARLLTHRYRHRDPQSLGAPARRAPQSASSCGRRADARPMRSVIGIAIVLLGIGFVSCRWGRSAASVPQAAVAAPWIRTVDGWERVASWQPTIAPPPRLHPLVMAAAEVLVSVLALVATAPSDLPARWPARRSAPQRRPGRPASTDTPGDRVATANR